METPGSPDKPPSDLPPVLAALEARAPSRSAELRDIARCIGCLTARKEPISSGAIAVCHGIAPSGTRLTSITSPLKWLETNDLVEPYTPAEPPEMPPWGLWGQHQANLMRLTRTGFLAVSIRAQQDCRLEILSPA